MGMAHDFLARKAGLTIGLGLSVLIAIALTISNDPDRLPASKLAHDDEVLMTEIRKQGYFEHLDYWDPKVSRKIPAFEAKLEARLPEMRRMPPAKAAMWIASTAMYFVNTGYGIRDGKLDASKFALKDLTERSRKVSELLEEAARIDSDNRMIDAWVEGERIRATPGHDLEALLKRVEADPVFALFSTLILAQEFRPTPEQDERLFKAVQYMSSSKGPCQNKATAKENPSCTPNKNAPTALLGSYLMMGDAYLRKAQQLFQDSDPSNDETARSHATYAWVMYKLSGWVPKTMFKTMSWRFRQDLKARRKLARAGMKKKTPVTHWAEKVTPFWETEAARRPYSCAACHSK